MATQQIERRERVRRLLARDVQPEGLVLEGTGRAPPLAPVDDILQRVEHNLSRVPAEEIQDAGAYRRALEFVLRHAKSAHQTDGRGKPLSEDELVSLEAVVKADGSRPSLLLKNGAPDPEHPLAGGWKSLLAGTREKIARIARSIGRVEPGDGGGSNFFGTGTVVDKDKGLVLTNLHVLQALLRRATTIAEPTGPGRFRIHEGAFIDFVAESNALETNRFKIVEGVSSGIEGPMFAQLDASILRIEPTGQQPIPDALPFTADPAGPQGGLHSFCVIGYPGRPPATSGSMGSVDWAWVNQTLFGARYGLKRLAPGEVHGSAGFLTETKDPRKWVFGHDATTLGGNSGSPIIDWNDGAAVFGLHFAGSTDATNYAHAIGQCADELRAMGVPVQAAGG